MLQEIHIKNLGIIHEADLEFTEGLTVITGETGAGKTMVLSALHLLLGQRANTNMIAENAPYATVEGCWYINNPKIQKDIEETGAIIEDGQLFTNRTIKSDGKSRATIGGKSTPASVLSRIGQDLINIHGQSDQQRLKSPTEQRKTLDQYAQKELAKELEKYSQLYKEWQNKKKLIERTLTNATTRKREINTLKTFLKDYENINPQPQEDTDIEQQINALSNVEEIREQLTTGYQILNNTESSEIITATQQLEHFIHALKNIKEYSPTLQKISITAEKITDELDNLINSVEKELDNLDTDALEQLYTLQERELELKKFIKKHGNTLDEIIEQKDNDEKRLAELEEEDQPIEELQEELQQLYTTTMEQAEKISAIRQKHAKTLCQKVNQELSGLAMKSHTLKILFDTTELSSSGIDDITFALSTKNSSKVGPIAKTASGGELSRIMLALEVVLADTKKASTFVFDEVDSGVGGETAIEIGKRLAKLAQKSQIIVVTHLPQVAAYADNHLKVIKNDDNDTIQTTVEKLDKKLTQKEITRMLSGMTNSNSGQEHAKELLEHAETFKNNLQ